MQKRYSLRLNQDIRILEILLRDGQKISYRKKQQGWGLNESYFENNKISKKYIISRRIFGNRKQELLDSNFIRYVKSKKSNENCYCITPLGIVFLASKINLVYEAVEKTNEIISYHYKLLFERLYKDRDLSNIEFDLIKNIFKKSDAKLKRIEKSTLQDVLKGIKIFNEGDKITVYFTYSIPQQGPIVEDIFTISKGKINHDYQVDTAVRLEQDKNWFDGALAHFITMAFNHKLILQNFITIAGKPILPPNNQNTLKKFFKICSSKSFQGFSGSLINNFEIKSVTLKSILKLMQSAN